MKDLDQITYNDIATVLSAPEANVEKYWPLIANALTASGMYSKWPVIAALATIGVETGKFAPINEVGGPAYFTEMYDINGKRPKVAKALGNIYPGDGVKFHGRGFIQLTGRHNYAVFGSKLGIQLETQPDLALDSEIASKIFVLYLYTHGVNVWANKAGAATNLSEADQCWRQVRRLVNGGVNGYATFKKYVDKFATLIS